MLLTSSRVAPDEFLGATGWESKPEGMCKEDRCVPVPGAVGDDGLLDVAAIAERLRMSLVHDDSADVWALGPEGGGRALSSAIVPPITLPDADGNPFDLTSLHGRKVLLVAWASW